MAAHPELARRIEPHVGRISQDAYDALQADPFTSSFPALQSLFAPARTSDDVHALIRALQTGDAAAMAGYVRRLQSAAWSAGATTRHLVASFRRLHDAIVRSGLSEAGAARTMLDRAVLALRYDDSRAAAVQDASRQMAEDAVVALRGVRLGDEEAEAAWIEALELLVSYLADAIATGRPELFSDTMSRLGQGGPSVVRPADPPAMLDALEGALDELPADARQGAAGCLDAARRALASPRN